MAYHKYQIPEDVRLFCMAAMLAGYRVQTGRQMLTVYAPDGTRLGNWDSLKKHWAVTWKLGSGREPMMRHYGFFEESNRAIRHRWWQREGDIATAAFMAVCEELTGVKISGIAFRDTPRRYIVGGQH